MSRAGDAAVIVELFGVSRLRASYAEVRVPAGTVAEVLRDVERACPGLGQLTQSTGRLAAHYLLSLNGERFLDDLQEVLGPGARVLLLSADAGG